MDPEVTALVYVAARHLMGRISLPYPESSHYAGGAGVQEREGFTYLPRRLFKYFSNGVAQEKAKVLYAEQEPTAARCSAGEPRRLPGAPSRAGMRCRNSIRQSRLTWNDFWQRA
jgi:hypothetical protein